MNEVRSISSEPKNLSKRIRILLVDDEVSFLEMSKIFLHRINPSFIINTSTSAINALTVLKSVDYDVIVSDYQMPLMNGLQFLEKIRKQNINDPFIMLTGKGREEVAIKALNLGANRYLQKGGDPASQYKILAKAVMDEVEYRDAELALLASEEQYRNLYTTALVGLFRIHLKSGRILQINKIAANMFGYSSVDELLKRETYVSDQLTREQRSYLYKQLMTSKGFNDYETQITRPDGGLMHVSVSAKLYPDTGYFEGMIKDITKRKETQERLEQSEARYRKFFEESPVSLWEEDFSEVRSHINKRRDTGIDDFRSYFDEHPEEIRKCASLVKIIDINQAALNLYKARTKEELFGNLENIFIEESYETFKEELISLTEGKTEFMGISPGKNLKGEEISFELYYSIGEGHEKTWSRILISIIDVTERKRTEKALEKSKDRERVLHTLLRHDLGNNLTKINGYLDLICYSDISKEIRNSVEKASIICNESSQLLTKITRLIDIEIEEETSKVDVGKYLRRAIIKNQVKAEEKNISIEYHEASFLVIGGSLLEELFYNLIENSIKHSKCTKIRIQVKVEEGENKVRIIIEDDGVEVPFELRDKIFSSDNPQDELNGIGLGTYLIRKIAERYNGKVLARKSELGGARFDLILNGK